MNAFVKKLNLDDELLFTEMIKFVDIKIIFE